MSFSVEDYKVKDTYDLRSDRKIWKLYMGHEVYIIETFIGAKRGYISALLEFNNQYPKYVNAPLKIEKINNLLNQKNESLKDLDKLFNRIFKKNKLYELKEEIIKLQKEKNLEEKLLVKIKDRLEELESLIITNQGICLKYYSNLDKAINELSIWSLKYIFKTYNLQLEKSDNNYFDEEMEMKAVLRDYLFTDSYLILDIKQPKRLVK